MSRLNYRSPAKSARSASPDLSEFTPGLITLILGLVLYGVGAAVKDTSQSAFVLMAVVFIAALIETALGIAAAFITAKVMSVSFGELRSAWLKLAGVIVLSGAVSFLIPMGWILSFFIYLGLLMWFFDLSPFEAFVFAIIFFFVRLVAGFFIVTAISAAFA